VVQPVLQWNRRDMMHDAATTKDTPPRHQCHGPAIGRLGLHSRLGESREGRHEARVVDIASSIAASAFPALSSGVSDS
jgi:hypothetical protein